MRTPETEELKIGGLRSAFFRVGMTIFNLKDRWHLSAVTPCPRPARTKSSLVPFRQLCRAPLSQRHSVWSTQRPASRHLNLTYEDALPFASQDKGKTEVHPPKMLLVSVRIGSFNVIASLGKLASGSAVLANQ